MEIAATIIIGSIIIGYTFWVNKKIYDADEQCNAILAILLKMGHSTKNTKNLLTKFYTKQFPTTKSQWFVDFEAADFANKIIKKSQTIDPNVKIVPPMFNECAIHTYI